MTTKKVKTTGSCPGCGRFWQSKYEGSKQCGICEFYANPDKIISISPPWAMGMKIDIDEDYESSEPVMPA